MVTDDPYSEPEKGEKEVGRSSVQRRVNSDTFYTKTFTAEGREFFIFADIGDYLKGKLLNSRRDNSHINRTVSYCIQVEKVRRNGRDLAVKDGQIEEFFANRQLQRFIKGHQLVRKNIRIIFIGKQKSGFSGHAAKVYRVFIDDGIFQESESEINEPKKRNYPKNRKSAGRRTAAGSAGC